MNIDNLIPYFIAMFTIAVVAGGVYLGLRATSAIFSRPVFTTENAEELLKIERVEEWNVLRSLNPAWQPILAGVDLSNSKLSSIDLRSVILDDANLSGADLAGTNFRQALARRTDFSRANLTGANFFGADLEGANFNRANLSRAIFLGARMSGTVFTKAIIDGVVLVEDDAGETVDIPFYLEAESEGRRYRLYNELLEHNNPQTRRQFLQLMTWRDLEDLVIQVLFNGRYEVHPSLSYSDEGIDFLARKQDLLGETIYAVQCKLTNDKPIDVITVKALHEVLSHKPEYDKALLVTNGTFTSAAEVLAREYKDIELIDGMKLIDLRFTDRGAQVRNIE